MDTLTSLALTVDAKDQFTEGHSRKVSAYAVLIAEAIGLTGSQIEEIRLCRFAPRRRQSWNFGIHSEQGWPPQSR